MSSFEGKIAIVTGGASGIGRAVCEALGERGAVVVVADLAAEGAAEVARGIVARGGRAEGKALDVRDAEAVQKVVDDSAAAHGRLDYLFNNAGIAIMGEERDVSLDDWRRVVDIDLYGVIYGVRAAYPIMVRQGSGHIVNTASLAGLAPAPGEASYAAAKFGVVGLSYALRAEGARLGVKISVVCPGFIDTPILQVSPIRMAVDRAKLLAMTPRPMAPEACAREILRGVEKNRATIVPTGHAKVLWALQRLSPNLTLWMAERIVERVRALRDGPVKA
jgi:NAD(P)-dependent dehydrogenase (short-subunit alcohol dehydrogenase family)